MKRDLPTAKEIKALPKDGGPNYNRLIFEDSLYLKCHAHQAIDWYPWGQMAFDLAKVTNKPLFLSIGYSSCHWCHVMSEQTFDRSDVAQLLNSHFVSIKVDRDQYPDIDQIYMNATQLLTQHGGWPNSVFCLPTGQPFYAGTYFPPDDHARGPGFITLLSQLAGAWKHNHDEILKQAEELERVIIKMNALNKDPHESLKLRSGYDAAISSLIKEFDQDYGGFGRAPKFPPYAALRLLLQDGQHQEKVKKTLRAMAFSGLYDHVEGGFHRYSTDQEWHLPHFEKMLMDNAQMIELYSLMARDEKDPLFERIVTEIIDHLLRSWALNDGGYLATIDADSAGGEGHYYVISYDELSRLADDATVKDWAAYFQITSAGNMRDEATGELTGLNIFHPLDESCSFDLSFFKKTLRLFREQHRDAPQKDHMFMLAPNAWLVKSLYIAASVFSKKEWRLMADQLMDHVLNYIRSNVKTVYLDGVVYALAALIAGNRPMSDCEPLWQLLCDEFYDFSQGGLWYSQYDHRTPMSRIKDIYDKAEPSPNGVFIACAIQLYHQSNDPKYYEKALDVMTAFMTNVMQSPKGSETYWLGVQSFWQLHDVSSLFQVQFIQCICLGEDVISIQLDLKINAGYYLMHQEKFMLMIESDYEWLDLQVDPTKARRMDWSPKIVSCASDVVRINGRCKIMNIPDVLKIRLPICSDTVCHEPVQLSLPIQK